MASHLTNGSGCSADSLGVMTYELTSNYISDLSYDNVSRKTDQASIEN